MFKLKKINGLEFKSMLISAGNNLFNYYPEIDNLNVFPVPDGDTGTNMNLTFSSGIKEIANLHNVNIGEVSKAFAKGLLMGARGNSGVITSQIFKGISLELENKESVDAITLAKAFYRGQKVAYKAVMKPVEGTILTVIRESSEKTLEKVKSSNDIKDVMEMIVSNAKVSLENTPNLLPILKEVGVVDSGGFGLLKIFEGMQAYLLGKSVERSTEDMIKVVNDMETFIDNHDGQYGYCTEFIIKLNEKIDEQSIRDFLEKHGESIVVVSDDDILKVHVHSLDPGKVLSKAITLGDLVNIKIENMQEQADNNESFKVVDTKDQAIIVVSSGSGIDEMFKELRVDKVISGGQTMNPSTKNFVKAIKEVNAKNVIILPNNSNIILAAQQAVDVLANEVNVQVIPTKTVIQGMVACINNNPELSFEDNLKNMNDSLKSVKSGEVTFAIKNTKFNGHKINKNDFMGIFEKDLIANGTDIFEVTKQLLIAMIDEDSELVTLITGKGANEEVIDKVVEFIEDKFDLEVEIVDGQQELYTFYIGVE